MKFGTYTNFYKQNFLAMFTFSIFCKIFSKNPFYFDVAWLISQKFSHRDLKPVAFLVENIILLNVKLYGNCIWTKRIKTGVNYAENIIAMSENVITSGKAKLPNCQYTYSSSYNLTPPTSRVMIGQHLIFCSLASPTCCNSPRECTPVKYKARQKAGFRIVT